MPPRGLHLGVSILLSLYQRVDAVMAGSSSSTILTDTLLSSAFTRLHPEIGSRQASHHRLPEASMYVNLADDMHFPASAGGQRQGSNILWSSLYLHPSRYFLHHSIWPLQKTMMGSCDRRADISCILCVRPDENPARRTKRRHRLILYITASCFLFRCVVCHCV